MNRRSPALISGTKHVERPAVCFRCTRVIGLCPWLMVRRPWRMHRCVDYGCVCPAVRDGVTVAHATADGFRFGLLRFPVLSGPNKSV